MTKERTKQLNVGAAKQIVSFVCLGLGCLIALAVIGLNVFVVVSTLTSDGDSLWGHMFPLIETAVEVKGNGGAAVGDLVLCTDEFDDLKVEDVVAVNLNGIYCLKRVTAINEQDGIVHYSISADTEDEQWIVTNGNILGKATFTIPFLGSFILFANTVWGAIVLIGLPTAVLVIGEVQNWIAIRRRKKSQ